MLRRYYIDIEYVYNRIEDSVAYSEAATYMENVIMRRTDSTKRAKFCVTAKEALTIQELKNIVKKMWSIVSESTGGMNGFTYKRLRPDSYKVNINVAMEDDWCYTAMDIIRSSNKIVECFSGQDTRNIFCRSDNEHDKIHAEIKTIADCL